MCKGDRGLAKMHHEFANACTGRGDIAEDSVELDQASLPSVALALDPVLHCVPPRLALQVKAKIVAAARMKRDAEIKTRGKQMSIIAVTNNRL